ncbi:MAG: multicopper oxidase [Bryobacteraceae bacterium]|nr:multicopper oxidase [Bryobacteraceae bacterium]
MDRRKFLGTAAIGGVMPFVRQAVAIPIPGGTLHPLAIAKYQMPLIIPPAMPMTGQAVVRGGKSADYYEIAVRQFRQQILPGPLPQTTVWSYGSANHPGTFNYPAFTIEATYNKPVRVKWINDLKDSSGRYLRHLLPVDQTLHWANPAGGVMHRDHHGSNPAPYDGPVPLVTHVHGAHTTDESDGYAEAWYLPAASNIPGSYAREGTWYNHFKQQFLAKTGVAWQPGSAVAEYPNDQPAATLWYHDHSLGMTRCNVYAGPAGFYLLRGGPNDVGGGNGVLPGPAPRLGDRAGTRYYEIPIAIQDRSFNADGSLFYPASRAFFDGYAGPYAPGTPVPPIWNPEFFGNTMVVNGRTWPFLQVEQRRYRLRLLNGCNSRFLILRFDHPGLTFWQIGAEGGFLRAPVQLRDLLMSPAERADVIVDFSTLPVGTVVTLLNVGPDEPFGGGTPGVDFLPADPATTGQVMQFRVVARNGNDNSQPPDRLPLPNRRALGGHSVVRRVSLNEEMFFPPTFGEEIPVAALLGRVNGNGGIPLKWSDGITENPALGATELWEIYNFTADAHPIHVHEVMFEVVSRQAFAGTVRPPQPWELGLKDTVIAFPDEITRIKARFDLPGLYVWHCHIVEHEDNEMMRPYAVGPMPVRRA